LTNGYVTFACFNNLSKMTDVVVNTWVRVLNAVPQSRLFFKSQWIAELSLRQQLCERFTSQGIALQRLILEDYGPRVDYLAAYNQVDIALDPFPYPGGTTTVEAIWMGVPVLTLSGEHFLSRQGVGLLANAGLHDWIATDTDDYVARAASHASDLQSLTKLRAGLRRQVLDSPIYDTERFAEHFEAALRAMWQKWCVRDAAAQPQT
jgi:predicted O-linked N-acetylglucosamine transferase (SPINDLY family)